jgi:hypothetical protein
VQQIVGLDPELIIVILGRDGSLEVANPAAAFLEKVDFAGGDIAERLFPMGRNVPVVLDPDLAASKSRRCPAGFAPTYSPSSSTPERNRSS